MIIQFVKFKSGLSLEEVRQIMEERAPLFRAVPGLLQKYYAHEAGTDEVAGIYFWDSEESLQAFRASELARTIPIAYQTTAPPRVEILNVLFPLRTEVGEPADIAA